VIDFALRVSAATRGQPTSEAGEFASIAQLKMTMNAVSAERLIANIASDDGLILPHSANPTGSNFRERQVCPTSRPPHLQKLRWGQIASEAPENRCDRSRWTSSALSARRT
jgi:hypothetical protein